MKDIKNIIGKTIKDVIYDGDNDASELTLRFDDDTEIIIATEYNAPNMWEVE